MELIASVTSILLFFVAGAICDCRQYENKIYQRTIYIPNATPFYAALTFLPKGILSSQDSTAQSLQRNVHSDITGYYRCLNSTTIYAWSTAFYHTNPAVSYLNGTGAIGFFQ